MLEKFLNEYNKEFNESIKPLRKIQGNSCLYLEFKKLSEADISEFNRFTLIYKLHYSIFNSHNSIYVKIY